MVISVMHIHDYVSPGDGDEETVQEVDEDEEKKPSLSKGERSHLIVWEVSMPQ